MSHGHAYRRRLASMVVADVPLLLRGFSWSILLDWNLANEPASHVLPVNRGQESLEVVELTSVWLPIGQDAHASRCAWVSPS